LIVEVDDTVLAATMAGTFSTGVVLAASTSVVTPQAPSSYFSLVNSFQFYFLLLLTGGFIPKKVVKLITSVDFALFNFNFLSLSDTSGMAPITNSFDFEQKDGN